MEGVTILSETVVSPCVASNIFLIVLGALAGILAVVTIIKAITERVPSILVLTAVAVFMAVALIIVGADELKKSPHTLYKVTVDEDVSFVEFNDKYEVIKQDGLIYEVRERTK